MYFLFKLDNPSYRRVLVLDLTLSICLRVVILGDFYRNYERVFSSYCSNFFFLRLALVSVNCIHKFSSLLYIHVYIGNNAITIVTNDCLSSFLLDFTVTKTMIYNFRALQEINPGTFVWQICSM